jgi:hypothetical protein
MKPPMCIKNKSRIGRHPYSSKKIIKKKQCEEDFLAMSWSMVDNETVNAVPRE